MYDICCIGHITADKIVTPRATVNMPGGTAIYFSKAIRHLDVTFLLVTAVGNNELGYVEQLRHDGIEVLLQPTAHTVCFENIYGENTDHRVQKVSQEADAFSLEPLHALRAQIIHLGPLLAADMPDELITSLAAHSRLSLDVQGFLRDVKDGNVVARDWNAKEQLLPYIHTLKANEHEAAVLTGEKDIHASAKILAGWGVKEVVITLGSLGSVIYAAGQFTEIPAYPPAATIDATGCGDTYMAGYLYQRSKGQPVDIAGRFAAAMATLKIQASGPFSGSEHEVWNIVHAARA